MRVCRPCAARVSGGEMKYFNTGPLPFFLAMATSPKEFDRGCKRLGVTPPPFAAYDAAMHEFRNTTTNGLVCVVCIDASKAKKYTQIQIHSLLTHEAVHVWQALCDSMGEEAPGREVEAYSIQWMTQCLAEHLKEVIGK